MRWSGAGCPFFLIGHDDKVSTTRRGIAIVMSMRRRGYPTLAPRAAGGLAAEFGITLPHGASPTDVTSVANTQLESSKSAVQPVVLVCETRQELPVTSSGRGTRRHVHGELADVASGVCDGSRASASMAPRAGWSPLPPWPPAPDSTHGTRGTPPACPALVPLSPVAPPAGTGTHAARFAAGASLRSASASSLGGRNAAEAIGSCAAARRLAAGAGAPALSLFPSPQARSRTVAN